MPNCLPQEIGVGLKNVSSAKNIKTTRSLDKYKKSQRNEKIITRKTKQITKKSKKNVEKSPKNVEKSKKNVLEQDLILLFCLTKW